VNIPRCSRNERIAIEKILSNKLYPRTKAINASYQERTGKM